jgi:hypothetical protein
MIEALRSRRSLPYALDGWQKQAHQNRHDGNHDQQFDQRETNPFL